MFEVPWWLFLLGPTISTAIGYFMGVLSERAARRDEKPYSYDCLVKGCGFHVAGSDPGVVALIVDHHKETNHPI